MQGKMKELMQLRKRDHVVDKSTFTSFGISPRPNMELKWEQSVVDGYFTGVSRLIIPTVFTRLNTNFEIDAEYDITGKSGYGGLPRVKEIDTTLNEEPPYLNLDMKFMDPTGSVFITIKRQMFLKKRLGNGIDLYEIEDGAKCLPAVKRVEFRISKPDAIDRIPLLNPIGIIKEHLEKYTSSIVNMVDNKTEMTIPDTNEYDTSVALANLKANVITLFVNLSLFKGNL